MKFPTRKPRSLTRRRLISTAASGGVIAAAGAFPRAPAIGQNERQDLRIGIWGGDFGNLNPVIRWTVPAALVMNHIFDGLVRVDYQNRSIMPWLAEEWANPDPLTWRVKLREGVQWHGGYGEFTAEDIVYTWQRHLDTSSFLVGSGLFPLDTFKADGKHVLEIKTVMPYGALPGVTMGYGGLVVSRAAHQEMGDQQYSVTPVGTGPYVLESMRGNEINLVRNENYWRAGFPKLARLNYRAIPDSA
ncbi:MAG: ABC transporter substrate-binding protein, partial [Rhodospirillaceae bacterium]